ncbi:MAG: formylglycine-generating enzyme family protein [Dysgonamonadaceae bacterium]|nr:formylglycine-generating enzyme family protein [Dysgonamonadaceae bacterium]
MKRIFLNVAIIIMFAAGAQAQVTIGSLNDPQTFSVLELTGVINGNGRGLRLPQMTTAQRDALHLGDLTDPEKTKAPGLQIFNTFTRCVETWNGTEWIQQCDGEPLDPQTTDVCTTCEVSTANNLTFTAKDDPAAVGYEFFIDNASQGYQISNSITFTASPTGTVGVKYYYPSEFLKPKMIPVAGSSSWKYGSYNYNTITTIPALQWAETPITQAQYEAVMGGNPSKFRCGGSNENSVSCRPTSALPVENVTWFEAIIYCNKLSKIEGKTSCYSIKEGSGAVLYNASDLENMSFQDIRIPTRSTYSTMEHYTAWRDSTVCDFSASGYRLPTESEWEYTARGGTSNYNAYSGSLYAGAYGDADAIDSVGWYGGNNGSDGVCIAGSFYYGTKEVKTKKPNIFGLYDMSGNVYEWCWNKNDATFPASTPAGIDENFTADKEIFVLRMIRGGYWDETADHIKLTIVTGGNMWDNNYDLGFRVVCK